MTEVFVAIAFAVVVGIVVLARPRSRVRETRIDVGASGDRLVISYADREGEPEAILVTPRALIGVGRVGKNFRPTHLRADVYWSAQPELFSIQRIRRVIDPSTGDAVPDLLGWVQARQSPRKAK
jgi:hypothetical protein